MKDSAWLELGNRIKSKRLGRGLTQSQLGGAQFTKSFVSQIERGKAVPSLDNLRLIADRLGCSVSELVGGSGWTEKARTFVALSEANLLLGHYEKARQTALEWLWTSRGRWRGRGPGRGPRSGRNPKGHDLVNAPTTGEAALLANLWLVVGICHMKRAEPRPEAALRCMDRAQVLVAPAPESWITAAASFWKGAAFSHKGLPLRALKCYEDCLNHLETLSPENDASSQFFRRAPVLRKLCLEQLALLHEQFNDRELARSIRSTESEGWREITEPDRIAEQLLSRAGRLIETGRVQEALGLALEAGAMAKAFRFLTAAGSIIMTACGIRTGPGCPDPAGSPDPPHPPDIPRQ